MKPSPSRLPLAAAIGLLALIQGMSGRAAESGFTALQNQIVEHTLKNGLRLIILPRHDVPVFSFATVANVGSVDEVVGITGLAHMFEHMAFKGTSRIGTSDIEAEKVSMAKVDEIVNRLKAARRHGAPAAEIAKIQDEMKKAEEEASKSIVPNEFDAILSSIGAVGINASTSTDFTTYFYGLPSNKIEYWMSLESERFVDPVLREFYQERDVVKEERFMRIESNPIGKMVEEFLSMAYKAHPYGYPPSIGHTSDLDSLTRQKAADFYKQHYGASNLIVALVGDVDPNTVIPMAETYFGRLPAGTPSEPIETIEPPQDAERKSTIYGQTQRLAVIGYHKPAGTSPDEPAYQALTSLLSDGRTSRLYRALIRDKQLAADAGGFSGFPGEKYPNLFLFYGFTTPGHTNDEVLAAMDVEIERLKNELVSTEELDRVKAKAKADLIQALSSNQGMAVQLAQQEALTGDWRDLFTEIDKINAVTPADIQRIARETFKKSGRTIVVMEPETPEAPASKPTPAPAQGD